MNIEGLSEQTIDKFISKGFISDFSDIYMLDRFRDEIIEMDGFGEKSYENIINSVDVSRTTSLSRVLYGIGILNVGNATAKLICRHFKSDINEIVKADAEQFAEIDGVGPVIADTVVAYFADEGNLNSLNKLLKQLTIIEEKMKANRILQERHL